MKISFWSTPWVLAMVGSVFLLAGCGKSAESKKKEATPPATASAQTPNVKKADVPLGDADLLQNLPVGSAATNAVLAEGDKAWRDVLQSIRPPSPPAEWETNQPSNEAIAEFKRKNGVLAAEAAGRIKEFYAKYPKHEMAGEAKDREMYLLGAAVQLGNTNAVARLSSLEEAKLKDPSLSEEERIQMRVEQLQRSVMSEGESGSAESLAALEKGARALMKEFPKKTELNGLLLTVAQGWLQRGDGEKARNLVKEVGEGSSGTELQTAAQALLKKINRVGQPLAMKFTTLDGKPFDLAEQKGKVVLIDFWATWCGPCMQELPNLKAAYEKLKPKGFEIVGISLDREKEALEKVVARDKISWPQFHDAESKLAEEFEIESIPTLWLIDKKGNLRDLNAREDLSAKVEKLLAE